MLFRNRSFVLADRGDDYRLVRTRSGGAVSGASLWSCGEHRATSGRRFTGPTAGSPSTTPLTRNGIVRAGGFATKEQPVSGGGEVEIVLSTATLARNGDRHSRTAARTGLGDIPPA